MEFHAEPLKIRKVLKSNVTYSIPDFQREYSWDKENILEFWNDLNNSEDLFFGSFVLVGNKNDTELYIVDGQQRLTTITILLSVIRDFFKLIEEIDLVDTTQSYIVFVDDDKKLCPILKNETPYPFFQNLIQDSSKIDNLIAKTDEEKLITQNKNLFKSYIEQHFETSESKEDKNLFLKKIRDKLLNIDVIYILVDTLDNAHTIFETLNNRGRDLEVIDLVKNYIFKSYPSQIANNKNEKWKGMIKDIKSNKKQFFNHFWASQYEKATQSKQYKSFLSYFEKATENEIKDFLDLLIDKAKLYKKITSPKIDDYKEKEKQPIFEALSNLVLFEIEQVRIFLLSLLYEFEKTKALKLKDVIRVLKSIEKFHFIFNTICKSKPSGIELMYSKFAIQLHKSENKKKVLDSLIEQLKNKTPSYNEYQEKFKSRIYFFEDKTISDSKQKKLVKYVLSELEYITLTTKEFKIDDISIEHLYPKSMKWGSIDKQIVSSIGNLLLLDRELNNSLKDSSYENKKIECVKVTKINSTLEVFNGNNKWGEEEIKNRENEIIKKSYDLFKLVIA